MKRKIGNAPNPGRAPQRSPRLRRFEDDPPAAQEMRRRLIALLQAFEAIYNIGKIPGAVSLSPRQRETLERLILGDSEKQIASALRLSQHTVHMHVKEIYRRLAVNSRGELLSLFVRRPFSASPGVITEPDRALSDS